MHFIVFVLQYEGVTPVCPYMYEYDLSNGIGCLTWIGLFQLLIDEYVSIRMMTTWT